MRRIILFIACSLDGFIAGPNGEIGWLFSDQDYGYNDFFASVDTVLMGRKTFELAESFAEYPYKGKRCVVFTRHKSNAVRHGVEFSASPVEFTKTLPGSQGKDIWLVGGGEIVSLFLANGLVDEIRLFVHPIILGNGIPLFKGISKKIGMELVEVKSYSSGLAELHYLVKRGSDHS